MLTTMNLTVDGGAASVRPKTPAVFALPSLVRFDATGVPAFTVQRVDAGYVQVVNGSAMRIAVGGTGVPRHTGVPPRDDPA
ncbi:MAG: hypothetical protein H0T85_11320 [Geodermatophilaceae bacterium]|nr:hypothetical protein [Geodermatophilaceae bacterium]